MSWAALFKLLVLLASLGLRPHHPVSASCIMMASPLFSTSSPLSLCGHLSWGVEPTHNQQCCHLEITKYICRDPISNQDPILRVE